MERAGKQQKRIVIHSDLQCGSCGTLCHLGEAAPRFCSCCGAAYDRFCTKCNQKVNMFFEEWWPGDDECVRTYTPAKRCPQCNTGLRGESKRESDDSSSYKH